MKTTIDSFNKMSAELYRATDNLPKDEQERLGKMALELISDYPLYVSGTSNISYVDAILIAGTCFGDIETAYKIMDESNEEPDEMVGKH